MAGNTSNNPLFDSEIGLFYAFFTAKEVFFLSFLRKKSVEFTTINIYQKRLNASGFVDYFCRFVEIGISDKSK